MSELSDREWAAKVLRGLKENSRRFAKGGKAIPQSHKTTRVSRPRTKKAAATGRR